ncbi:glycosyl hydrolase family 43 [Segetibacter sp. 3557_3]|nr:glycosyl hydrolase family 43 [Segetibacter sp. 3557_3]
MLLSVPACKKGSNPYVPPPYVAPRDSTFTNPLLSSGADPWVYQKDSFYYYTNTLGDKIQLWRTKSMSQLGKATVTTIWTKPGTGANSQNVWAPELWFLDSKWYAYYTAGSSTDLSSQRMFVLENSSADPLTGTWVDKGKIADPAADYFAIDATVLEHNNKRYLLWSGHTSASDDNQHLYIAQLSNPWTLSTSRTMISSPQYAWERLGAPPAVNEGPEILKSSTGRVFLTYSASGCWTDDYSLGLLTLRDGGDPLVAADWIKTPQPVFTKSTTSQAYGPGHNGFFKSPDRTEDWIIYHANPQSGQGCNPSRNPRIQKFTWRTDGTPDFGQPVPIGTKLLRPSGEKD